jgi:hypothetical protein
MATIGYNTQTFYRAFKILVLDEGDIRNRLFRAAPELRMLEPEVFPASWREDIKWIQHMLTRYPETKYVSRQEATFSRTRSTTAKKVVERVWMLYERLHELD